MRILQDKTGTLTLEDILSPRYQQLFEKSLSDTPNYSFSSSVYWLEFTINNKSTKPLSLYLEHSFPLVDHLSLFIPQQPSGFSEVSRGDKSAISKHDKKDRFPVFALTPAPGLSTYYLRYDDTTGATVMPFALWHHVAYENYSRLSYALLGLLFGIIVAMLIFNLFVAVKMKSLTYATYVAYIICFLMVLLVFQGLSPHIFEEGAFTNFFQERGMLIAIQGCYIFGCIFTIRFLDTRQRQPLMHKVLIIMLASYLVQIVLILTLHPLITSLLVNLSAGVSSMVLIISGVSSFAKNYKPAFYYTLGWTALSLGNLGLVLKYMDLIPVGFYTEWGQPIGGSLEVIFLSLALGDRLNFIRNEAENRIRDLNTMLQGNLFAIEKIVEERTNVIRTITDNVKSGFLLVGRDLKVLDGFTKSCHALFLTTLRPQDSLTNLLALEGREKEHFEAAIEQIFEDILPEKVTLAQLKKTYPIENRILTMEVSVVRSPQGSVDKLLMTINDTTVLAEKEQEAARNSMLLHINRYRKSFIYFIQLTRESLSQCRSALLRKDQQDVAMLLHTIKGNCAVYEITEIKDLIHGIEEKSEIAVSDIEAIERAFQSFLSCFQREIDLDWNADIEDVFNVENKALMSLVNLINQINDLSQLKTKVKNWISDIRATPAQHYLGPIDETVQRLSAQLGKKVSFRLTGGSTLLDFHHRRKIMGNLIHLIRNAIDHGIEDDRLHAGKPEYGRLEISIQKDEFKTIITVSDDGQGIDAELLEQKALAARKISRQEVQNMSAADKILYILQKGLSTRCQATDLSGRGVGFAALMDSVTEIGGIVSIQTEKSKGCTICLSIPKSYDFKKAAA
jgi:HPt (histidine-containing phosphotransfer) domain-containing protein